MKLKQCDLTVDEICEFAKVATPENAVLASAIVKHANNEFVVGHQKGYSAGYSRGWRSGYLTCAGVCVATIVAYGIVNKAVKKKIEKESNRNND